MSNLPEELKYAETHEWAREDGTGNIIVGITDHAQESLGDLVFVELPEVGDEVEAGSAIAVVESVKAASDIYAPVSGEIIAINELLEDEQLMNSWKMSRSSSTQDPMMKVGCLKYSRPISVSWKI